MATRAQGRGPGALSQAATSPRPGGDPGVPRRAPQRDAVCRRQAPRRTILRQSGQSPPIVTPREVRTFSVTTPGPPTRAESVTPPHVRLEVCRDDRRNAHRRHTLDRRLEQRRVRSAAEGVREVLPRCEGQPRRMVEEVAGHHGSGLVPVAADELVVRARTWPGLGGVATHGEDLGLLRAAGVAWATVTSCAAPPARNAGAHWITQAAAVGQSEAATTPRPPRLAVPGSSESVPYQEPRPDH